MFLVSRFLYRFDRWFSRLDGLSHVIFRALYSLLFGVSQGFVLKTVLWPIMVNFYKLWLGWESCLIGIYTTSSYIYLILYEKSILVKQFICANDPRPSMVNHWNYLSLTMTYGIITKESKTIIVIHFLNRSWKIKNIYWRNGTIGYVITKCRVQFLNGTLKNNTFVISYSCLPDSTSDPLFFLIQN